MWGFEYVKHLIGEIGHEWQARKKDGKDTADLKALVDEIVPFNVQNGSEPEACDLLMEVDLLPQVRSWRNGACRVLEFGRWALASTRALAHDLTCLRGALREGGGWRGHPGRVWCSCRRSIPRRVLLAKMTMT